MPKIKMSHGCISDAKTVNELKSYTMQLSKSLSNGYSDKGFAFYRGRIYSNTGVEGCLDLLGTDEEGNFLKVQLVVDNISSDNAKLVYGRKVNRLSTEAEVVDTIKKIFYLVDPLGVSKVYFDFCESRSVNVKVVFIVENDTSAGPCKVVFVDRGSSFYETYMLSDSKGYVKGTCLGHLFSNVYNYYKKVQHLVETGGSQADILKGEKKLASVGILI